MNKNISSIEFINYIEKNYPVNQWSISGVDIWPLIRVILGFKIVTKSRNTTSPTVEDNSLGKLPNLSNLMLENENVDVFVLMDSFSRIKLKDSWYHRLSGPFNEEIRKKGLHVVNLEFSYHHIERFPVSDESYSITNQLEWIENHNYISNPVYLISYESVKKDFLTRYGKDFDFPSIIYINNITSYIFRLSIYFEALLLEKKTKAVFIVNYYQLNSHALILAARRVGIPSVDIQHGNQRDLFYHQWLNVPSEGYNVLPNYFWCWDQKDSKVINEWADQTSIHKAINGGNPWIELWKDESLLLVKEYDQITAQYISEDEVNIILTLQPLYGLPTWRTNVPVWVVSAIGESPDNWKWHIRYHPQMLGNYSNEMKMCETLLKPHIIKGKVETKRATEEPLMAILRKMTVHITAFSTSVTEAMHLQVPSITIHQQAKEFYKNEIESGWVSPVKNSEELIEAIHSLSLKKRNNNLPQVRSESIGLSNGIDHILESLAPSNYKTDLDLSFQRKKIFLADGMYEQIINETKFESIYNEEFFISGKAFEGLGDFTKAGCCYYDYLQGLDVYENLASASFEHLLNIKKFYKNYNIIEGFQAAEFYINQLINSNDYIKGHYFSKLFKEGQYREIIESNNKVEHTLDTHFFKGRAYLVLNEITKGIKELEKYLESCCKDRVEVLLASGLNYKASAHFYLGEVYLQNHYYSVAEEHFEECNQLFNGQHKKAQEYLKLIHYKNRHSLD
ncbi:hypothetical protein HMPREF9372_0961 [Sporosarcina newyorkensis 2681]|uniref:Uncharacterized protein n=1 Tax=Sporosarcina newyorkensis 2681 TaxID=1027292 RepID=F9DQ81_9BACL|nr:hypothetical protein [Sporosarcina newyorkensis]EGQ27039.1 hypothetical protein HMPREF9372_0961 [Sporosarcina newyorkensis 2681]